jgi:hypothetical protein
MPNVVGDRRFVFSDEDLRRMTREMRADVRNRT